MRGCSFPRSRHLVQVSVQAPCVTACCPHAAYGARDRTTFASSATASVMSWLDALIECVPSRRCDHTCAQACGCVRERPPEVRHWHCYPFCGWCGVSTPAVSCHRCTQRRLQRVVTGFTWVWLRSCMHATTSKTTCKCVCALSRRSGLATAKQATSRPCVRASASCAELHCAC